MVSVMVVGVGTDRRRGGSEYGGGGGKVCFKCGEKIYIWLGTAMRKAVVEGEGMAAVVAEVAAATTVVSAVCGEEGRRQSP